MYLGTVIAMPLAGILAEYINWESIFYVFGRQLELYVLFIFPPNFCDDDHHFHHQDSWLSSGVAFGGGS